MPSSFAARILPWPAITLKSRSMMTGLIKPNSRSEERSFIICSGEWVRALFTYGTNFVMETSSICVVVLPIVPSLIQTPFSKLLKATEVLNELSCNGYDFRIRLSINGVISNGTAKLHWLFCFLCLYECIHLHRS